MGMFDKPIYLTGKDGWAKAGDKFYLHDAAVTSETQFTNRTAITVALTVSRTKDGQTERVLSSGAGISRQVQQMDAEDKASFPVLVELTTEPTPNGDVFKLAPVAIPF